MVLCVSGADQDHCHPLCFDSNHMSAVEEAEMHPESWRWKIWEIFIWDGGPWWTQREGIMFSAVGAFSDLSIIYTHLHISISHFPTWKQVGSFCSISPGCAAHPPFICCPVCIQCFTDYRPVLLTYGLKFTATKKVNTYLFL